jgi:ribonuclease P protein component
MIQFPQPEQPFEDASASVASSRSAGSARDSWLRKHADYQRVYKATRKQFSASMTWFLAARAATVMPLPQMRPVPGDTPRVGLTAGKVLGKAHERNRIKRRMREVVRRHMHELPEGVDLILHPRRSVMTMDFVKLETEVLRIFRQAAAQAHKATSQRPEGQAIAAQTAL